MQAWVEGFPSEGGRELAADVRLEYEHLALLLDGFSAEVPNATRPLLEAWRNAAWSIVSDGENASLDGCYWLLRTEDLNFGPCATAAAPDIRQAANALVRWCEAQSAAVATPMDQGAVQTTLPRGFPRIRCGRPSSPASRKWRSSGSNTRRMFRNPTKFKLLIHAARWDRYWADRERAGFEALDGDLPSVADDPSVGEDALAAALQRAAKLAAKKKAGKR